MTHAKEVDPVAFADETNYLYRNNPPSVAMAAQMDKARATPPPHNTIDLSNDGEATRPYDLASEISQEAPLLDLETAQPPKSPTPLATDNASRCAMGCCKPTAGLFPPPSIGGSNPNPTDHVFRWNQQKTPGPHTTGSHSSRNALPQASSVNADGTFSRGRRGDRSARNYQALFVGCTAAVGVFLLALFVALATSVPPVHAPDNAVCHPAFSEHVHNRFPTVDLDHARDPTGRALTAALHQRGSDFSVAKVDYKRLLAGILCLSVSLVLIWPSIALFVATIAPLDTLRVYAYVAASPVIGALQSVGLALPFAARLAASAAGAINRLRRVMPLLAWLALAASSAFIGAGAAVSADGGVHLLRPSSSEPLNITNLSLPYLGPWSPDLRRDLCARHLCRQPPDRALCTPRRKR
jgi:hypothetical protein